MANVTKAEWDAGAGVAADLVGADEYPVGKIAVGAAGAANLVSATNPFPVTFLRDATVHTETSTTPLGIGATFTGATFDSLTTGTFVTHHIIADQDGTHIFEQSTDGTNWDVEDSDAVLAGDPKSEAHIVTARYHRARYVNGGVAQTVFRHQSIVRVVGASHEIGIKTTQNTVQGGKTHNTTAPSANAHEVLGFVAKAAAPTYSEGAAVEARVTLSGDQAITLDGEAVAVTGTFWQTTQPVSLTSLPALVASTANIGDVDVLTVPAPLNVIGGGAEATALRVTLANDSTGVITVDNAGTFAVQATLAAETTKVIGTVNVAAAQTIAVTNAGTFATQSVATGNVAHDAVDSGNPIKTGGIARTANPTAVAALDRVDSFYDLEGRQIIAPHGSRGLTVHNTITLTSTTETTLIAAGAAGIFHDVLGIFVANSSATAVAVTIKDGTAGTTRATIYAPAGQNAGMMLPIPITQSAAAANWTATLSAAVSSVFVTAIAVKKTG